MKKIYFVHLIIAGFVLFSCGDAETKVDNTKTNEIPSTDSLTKDNVDTNAAPSGTARGLNIGAEPTEILTNIDKHLVSKVNFTSAGAAGGITNGMLTVQNTLSDATFQKAYVEVSILLADGSIFRTDYYTVQNLEPGVTKSVKLPNTTRGTSIVSTVVKVKSLELTNGEMILVGSRYVPN